MSSQDIADILLVYFLWHFIIYYLFFIIFMKWIKASQMVYSDYL